jgi:hypothetical protein
MKTLNPCKCGGVEFVTFTPKQWPSLPPGAIGSLRCVACGRHNNYPSTEQVRQAPFASDEFAAALARKFPEQFRTYDDLEVRSKQGSLF